MGDRSKHYGKSKGSDQEKDSGTYKQHGTGSPKYGETKSKPSSIDFRNYQTEQAKLKTEKYSPWISGQFGDQTDDKDGQGDNYQTLVGT